MSNVINWFEIPVQDLQRATAFYEHCIDAQFRQEHVAGMSMAVFHYQEPAIGGALVKSEELQPSANGTVVYLYTADIAASLKKVAEKGGTCCFGQKFYRMILAPLRLLLTVKGIKSGCINQPDNINRPLTGNLP